MFLRFNPANVPSAGVSMDKLGWWVDPMDVVDGGSKHLHYVADGGITFMPTGTSNRLAVTSPDAGTVVWGYPTSFPTPSNELPTVAEDGGAYILWDNIWCVPLFTDIC